MQVRVGAFSRRIKCSQQRPLILVGALCIPNCSNLPKHGGSLSCVVLSTFQIVDEPRGVAETTGG